ncbi:2Fe-2S iron-sulfur cluster-binding protein [Shimia thalassica]|jgi:2Fe-2S ferredoxin|uniref:Ferredoxin VI n=1 Tax=Shimia thalassica TaxID=1715693 RepID=A0A0P1I0F8_9RHOB|nr:2Fe-2S iron-sulfur cluster-binding protein [Shimia thalassica]MDO6481643.1 2Fe-2S iron-sulfur cluster-binding protein [Shimia thalassica]MDO6483990.1 2Fe-2S iron-sulfur cluster-binding protein [Shimia thalassica]MDO6798840.1 2Fe-2S iron-sulfur cluster-binding protein [Shimia thalassica]MDP2494595.1 2Fe-2S iron-sulfur cluster-binding protein [Shimia thalassica]MDP2518362.1 2Fe-2S iron-sulfur cluster-binding protein [Shimia thalassica]
MKAIWKLPNGEEITAEVSDGTNMMQAAVDNNVPGVVGECGGCLSCATCHVYVDPAWVEKTGVADDFEDAMLDVAEAERTDQSRLSCQIEASGELDGLVLIVPQP